MPTPAFGDHARRLADLWSHRAGALVVVRSVDSTNALARRILLAVDAPLPSLLVTAWEQTEGRGRRGNRWQSPPGGGIYATVVLPLPAAARLEALPLFAPAVVCSRLDAEIGPPCRIKWPNDLMVEGRKVGGVLIESIPTPRGTRHALVGVGVNLQAPRGLPATGLLQHADSPLDAAELAVSFAEALFERREELAEPTAAAAAFRALTVHRPGELLSYRDPSGEVTRGRFRGLDERGFLRLEVDGDERRVGAAGLVE